MNKYKAILLDIDNTLYDYHSVHKIAIRFVVEYCKEKFGFEEGEILNAYETARRKVHLELAETAASHNRLLYFQKMCELLRLNPLIQTIHLYNCYWDIFLENIYAFSGVYKLLERYKNNICFVTDLTAHIQYRKIEKLELNKYCQSIVTSEEAGREKPHPYVFLLALQKLNLQPRDVCMIGDSFSKDIIGAANLGIDSVWFNHENINKTVESPLIRVAKSFDEILELV